jgi:tetrahydromethanopterin S-methyltransferase subunit G
MAHLEGAFEQVSKRLDSIDRRLDGVEQRMDKRFTSLEGKIDRQFFWLLGLLIVSIILPIADRFRTH